MVFQDFTDIVFQDFTGMVFQDFTDMVFQDFTDMGHINATSDPQTWVILYLKPAS